MHQEKMKKKFFFKLNILIRYYVYLPNLSTTSRMWNKVNF